MRFDRSGFVSSTPQILGGNAPLVSFQGSGSFLPLQPLEPSEGNNAKISTHGSNGHALPSSLQQAAAAILQDFDDAKIFNCLSVLRSLSPEYLQSSHSEGLSIQQLTALSTLKDCRNDDIAACLEASRRRGVDNFQAPPGNADYGLHQAMATLSPEFWPDSSTSLTGLSAGLSGPPSFYDSPNASDITPRTISHANSFVDLSRENSRLDAVAPASGANHQHWCTVCERPSPISTCDGWKRHEKEKHEKGYMCMPNGPVEPTNSGLRCAFCGLLNPDQGHLEVHDAGLCAHKLSKDRRYTRKLGLINHLKAHGIFEASTFADRWRVWLRKKYYACGFCISIFSTNADRLNHIDSQHYKYSQNINEWDPNIVIRGLLLQPDVLASWHGVCPWNPDPRQANLTWDLHTIATLQSRLEMSEEPAHQLASDALCLSSVKSHGDIRIVSLPFESLSDQQTGNGERIAFEQQQYTMAPVPSSFPLFKPQDQDEASLHFQARNLSRDAAKYNTMDPVQMHIHPPQSLHAFPVSGIATGHPSIVTTLSPWKSDGYTDVPVGSQLSQDPSNIGAASVPRLGNLLGQKSPTALRPRQSDPSRCPSTSGSSKTPHQSVRYVGEPEGSRTSSRPGPSPSTHSPLNASFSSVTTVTGPAKPPSIVGHMKRRLSRMKMGIDVDDVMLHMQDDERSRSEWPAGRRSR